MTGWVTLLTDFGGQDSYVGVMKGVIAQINSSLGVIDLTHAIPPQDIAAARFHLMNAVPYFPPGTVHIAVVDPGVGGRRRAIALHVEGGYLVGPDNGLFGGVLETYPVVQAVELTHRQYWRSPIPSQTFHGRDIFAPVGAHLASGVPITALGSPIDPASLTQLALEHWHQEADTLVGCIQAIDHFGNLITNVPATAIAPPYSPTRWRVEIGHEQIASSTAYSDVPIGNLLALMGSHGWVEIAVNGGNAQTRLQCSPGEAIRIRLYNPESVT